MKTLIRTVSLASVLLGLSTVACVAPTGSESVDNSASAAHPVVEEPSVAPTRFRDPMGNHGRVNETMGELEKRGFTCTLITPMEGYECEDADGTVFICPNKAADCT